MEVAYNWTAIGAGVVTAMVLGMIWYSPGVFGARWMKAVGMTKKQMSEGQMKGMVSAVVRSALLSFALYHIIYVTAEFYSDQSFLQNAVGVGIWVGIAIVGMTMFMHDAFEDRSKVVTKVNVGFEIVTVFLVAVAIGLVAG